MTTESITWRIPNMDCAAEESEIRHALRDVAGVQRLAFRLGARELRVDAAPGTLVCITGNCTLLSMLYTQKAVPSSVISPAAAYRSAMTTRFPSGAIVERGNRRCSPRFRMSPNL